MKKLIALLLVLVMVMAMFVGCSSKTPADKPNPPETTEKKDPPATTTETPTTTEKELTREELAAADWIIDEDKRDYVGTIVAKSAFSLSQGMKEMIEEFNTYYPNITVTWENYKNNSATNVTISQQLAAGEIDVLVSFGLNYTSQRWKDGLWLDITDKLEDEGINVADHWGTDGYCLNDRYYTLPCGGLQYYVIINMDAWNEAMNNAPLPTEWTWDEYVEASRKMTKTNEDGTIRYGGSSYSSINTIMYCYSQVTGGDLYMNEDVDASNYDDPIVVKAFERELKAELEDKIWFPLLTYRNDDRKDYETFLLGEIASAVTCNTLRYVHSSEYDETRTWISGFAPFPVEEKGQTNYQSGVHHYSHVGISAKTKDETAAWLFMKFYATYGVKYLCKAGHQTHWKGTDTSDYLNILYGSEENAKKYIDIDSFKHVIGRTDLPNWDECLDELNILTYSDVTGCLKDPLMKALAGELTAKEALDKAAEAANKYITEAMG